MSHFRLTSVLLTGFLVMLLSGAGGYFWASQSSSPKGVQDASKQSTQTSRNQNGDTDSADVDTGELTPANWEAFLDYEGDRKQMLGIKKEYSGVNFRSGPGTAYEIRESPEGGTLLMPIDRITNWFRARLRSGEIGWIHKSVVRQIDVPLPIYEKFREDLPPLKESTKELIPEKFKKHNRIKVLETKVNLRQGPGQQFALAGRVYKFEEVRLFGKQGDWYRVKTVNDKLGWVYEELVEVVWKTPIEEQKTIEIKTSDPRMAPAFQFREAGTTEETLQARLLEVQPPWALVKIDDATIGWVHQKEVTQQLQSLIEQPSDQDRRPLERSPSTAQP